MDRITLHDLRFDAILGITDPEQRAPQPVVLDVALGLDVEPAAGGDLSRSIDYYAVQQAITMFVQYGRWRLLESIVTGLARLLLAPPAPGAHRAQVGEVTLTIRKPTILDGAVPSVTLSRTADWCELNTQMVPPKTWVDTLVETGRAGAYRVHVEPGAAWEVPAGAALHLLAGSASTEGGPVAPAQTLARGEAASVQVHGEVPASFLVVCEPALAL